METTDLAKYIPENDGNTVEVVDHYVTIQAGKFWRCLTDESRSIAKGEVVLLREVKYVEDEIHTVVVLTHPRHNVCGSGRVSYLVNDFVRQFEFEPEGERIRKEELAAVMAEIQSKQEDLGKLRDDPERMNMLVQEAIQKKHKKEESEQAEAIRIVRKEDLAMPVLGSLDAKAVESLQSNVKSLKEQAETKALILKDGAEAIKQSIKKMAPYLTEQAEVCMALASEEIKDIEKLCRGVESLELYVGKNVYIERIAQGEDAPYGEPLYVLQRKMMMDEEMCLFLDVNERFDYNDHKKFDMALQSHPELVDQIFVSKRSVCVMATTRKYIDYVAKNDAVNDILNRENRKVFLLVRNGGNIYRVYSSVESHLGTARLFPSKDDQDRIFQGWGGKEITFNDIEFTDKLEEHERFALHYKRFLLLMAGLDQMERLFGDFYPRRINFYSEEFQNRYMRFIHDDDGKGMLPSPVTESVQEFIGRNNGYITPGRNGSRIICDFSNLVKYDTAPGAFNHPDDNEKRRQLYDPEDRFAILPVRELDGRMYVEVPMFKRDWWGEKEKNSKGRAVRVFITDKEGEFYGESYSSGISVSPFLHYNTATLEEITYFLNHRPSRVDHLEYIRFFKHVEKLLQEREVALAPLFALVRSVEEVSDSLLSHLMLAHLATADFEYPKPTDHSAVAAKLVAQIRIHGQSDYIGNIASYLLNRYGKPVTMRHVATMGDGRISVYVEPFEEERNDWIEPFQWVRRIVLVDSKRGFRLVSDDWTLPPCLNINEVFMDNPLLESLTTKPEFSPKERVRHFASPERKAEAYQFLSAEFDPFTEDRIRQSFAILDKARSQICKKTVGEMAVGYPIRFLWRNGGVYVVMMFLCNPYSFFAFKQPHMGDEIKTQYKSLFRNKSAAEKLYYDGFSQSYMHSICLVPVRELPANFFKEENYGIPLVMSTGDLWDKWKEIPYDVYKRVSTFTPNIRALLDNFDIISAIQKGRGWKGESDHVWFAPAYVQESINLQFFGTDVPVYKAKFPVEEEKSVKKILHHGQSNPAADVEFDDFMPDQELLDEHVSAELKKKEHWFTKERYSHIEFWVSSESQKRIASIMDSYVYGSNRPHENGIRFHYDKDGRCRNCIYSDPEKVCTYSHTVHVSTGEGYVVEQRAHVKEYASDIAKYATGERNCGYFKLDLKKIF